MKEPSRQLVHISGLVFVLLVFFADRVAVSAFFFMVAFSLLFYSHFIRSSRSSTARIIKKLEVGYNHLVNRFERETTKTPFMGAFWFYFSCGLSILLFPVNIAFVSCSILAVSDTFSTLVGTDFGKHAIVGSKTIEGSMAFLISAFLISFLFVEPQTAVFTSITATLAELLPDTKPLKNLRKGGILDDNFTIPIVSGIVMLACSIF